MFQWLLQVLSHIFLQFQSNKNVTNSNKVLERDHVLEAVELLTFSYLSIASPTNTSDLLYFKHHNKDPSLSSSNILASSSLLDTASISNTLL